MFEDEKKLDQQDIQWLTYPRTSWEMALLFTKHNTIYKKIHGGEKKGHYAWNGKTRKWDMFDTEGCWRKVALILVLRELAGVALRADVVDEASYMAMMIDFEGSRLINQALTMCAIRTDKQFEEQLDVRGPIFPIAGGMK